MAFIRLLLTALGPARRQLVLTTVLAGVGTAAIMAIVNTAGDRRGGGDHWLLAVFILSGALVLAAQARALHLTTRASEATVERLRIRLAGLIRRADLDAFEALGPARIYGNVARDTATLSEAGPIVIQAAVSAVALVLAALYIAAFSALALGVVLALLAATAYFYRFSQRTSGAELARARQAEAEFFETLDQLLKGLKEAKMSSRRGDDLERHLAAQSDTAQHHKIGAMTRINAGLTVGHGSFYVLLAAVAFALPQYLDSTAVAMKIAYTVIFILSSGGSIMKALGVLATAGAAVEHLAGMEAQLVAATRGEERPASPSAPAVRRVDLRGVVYPYAGPDARPTFTVGPCDLTVAPGELVIVTGSNGGGKSTLLRLLTWLYEPRAGVVLWDDRRVDRSNVVDYRHLFAAVFADFHLFDRLYGMPGVDPARAEALLETVGIAGKTAYRDGRFTRLNLSTGQRKRLAFVVALLEDKPVYVLDELAADQDAAFRRRFYEELLPALRAQSRAVVAVSHDERYFHVADRVLVMEDGRLVDRGRGAPGEERAAPPRPD
jgi:putative ATP-binding cassette transporter